MPVIEPAGTQQVLQMSSAVEKVQTQQVQHLAADQYESEALKQLDLEQAGEIQDPGKTEASEPSDPESRGRRRRLRVKKSPETAETEKDIPEFRPQVAEEGPGTRLNITV